MKEGLKFVLTYVGILVGGVAVISIAGCAKRDQEGHGDGVRDIICYSGGKVVYQGQTARRIGVRGPVLYFWDKVTGKLITTSAQCVIGTEIPIVQD